jgi:hypothetical protein
MTLRHLAVGTAIVFCLYTPALSANFTIDNSADKIDNPAQRIYNPADQIKNPAATIYNPAGRMDNPNPISPPVPPITQSTATSKIPAQPQEPPLPEPANSVPQKAYSYKTVGAYITAAKKAFVKDDYIAFISISEAALKKISDGTLYASDTTKQKLLRYKSCGYKLAFGT